MGSTSWHLRTLSTHRTELAVRSRVVQPVRALGPAGCPVTLQARLRILTPELDHQHQDDPQSATVPCASR